MSVSISETRNVDLDAVMAGGDAFLDRIKTLKQAQADHEAALKSLNLGVDASRALVDAQTREAAAQKMMDDTKSEISAIIERGHVSAAEIVQKAQADADAMTAQARDALAAMNDQVRDGREVLVAWSAKTKAEADALMASAVRAKAAADEQVARNEQAARDLADAQQRAKDATDAADKLRSELTSKLDAIRAAAS